MKRKHLYLPVLLLFALSYIACNQTTASYNSDAAWINKENLTMKEIIDSAMSDVERVESFKYISANSSNVNFYGGQKSNTFLLDKKGNAFSSRNREQNFKIDDKMYTRRVGLEEEGLVATVISDVLDKSSLDKNYFEKNIPYVKQNAIININLLGNCRITTSVSGNTLTITTTDFEKVESKDRDHLTGIKVVYIPHKKIINTATFLKDGKKITTTYSFFFNPDEKVELPQLMKLGTILSPEESQL